MNPDAALTRIRELVSRALANEGKDDAAAMLNELAKLIEDLDGWLSSGGFLPLSWSIPA
jgi:hypothetical protein